jgi:carbon storage regulator
MLVLTRKIGEKIVIDGDIIVTVLGYDGSKIRLGIDAPRSVGVNREEVQRRRMASSDGRFASNLVCSGHAHNHRWLGISDVADEMEPAEWPLIDVGVGD